MNQAYFRAPFEFSKSLLAIAVVAASGAQTSAVIDRLGYTSAIADVVVGHTGAPTGGNVTVQMQDSVDGTSFANFGSPVVAPITAANASGLLASLGLDLSGARRFVRLVVTPAPTGGNAPVPTTNATLRLFGADRLPAA